MLDFTMFEMEYRHRSKSNPFSEKWINCTRSRTRIHQLKDFLYDQINAILSLHQPKEFFDNLLNPFLHREYHEFQDLTEESIPKSEKDPLYHLIYIKMSLDGLFVLLTSVIMWEHQEYPAILESHLRAKLRAPTKIELNDDVLQYYLRFLDVLSSTEIVSLFDLDALKNTIRLDRKNIGEKPLKNLYLFRDWPDVFQKPFHRRFPNFKLNLSGPVIENC